MKKYIFSLLIVSCGIQNILCMEAPTKKRQRTTNCRYYQPRKTIQKPCPAIGAIQQPFKRATQKPSLIIQKNSKKATREWLKQNNKRRIRRMMQGEPTGKKCLQFDNAGEDEILDGNLTDDTNTEIEEQQ